MKTARPFAFLPLGLAAAGLTACASLLGSDEVKVRPVEHLSAATAGQHDPLYESAVTAINARDYARALDYLQELRARDPRNVKALNALGVVYDKLGRFDLSARYYGQAQAVEPGSRIVAQNLDYSKNLQGLMAPSQVAAAAPAAPAAGTTAAEKPAVLASALQPPGLPTAPRASEAAPPVNNSLLMIKQLESSPAPVMVDPMPVGKPVHLDIALPESKPSPERTATKDADPPVNRPVVQAVSKSSQENKPAAAGTVAQVVAALPPAKPAASKPLPDIKTVAMNETPGAGVTSVTKSMPTKEPAAGKPVADSKMAAAGDAAPLAQPAMSKPVLETKTVAMNDMSGSGVTPATRPMLKEPVATKPISETKIASASDPSPRPAFEIKPREVVMAAPTISPVVKPLTASTAVSAPAKTSSAAAKPSTTSETRPVPASATVRRPESVKPAAPAQRPVAAPARTNTASLQENKPATAAKAATPIKIATPARKVLTIGQPLRIFNASGKAIDVVPHRLTSLGWTVRAADGRRQQTTALYYPAKDLAAAKALQATLPFPVRMIENPGAGVRLVVGRDYLFWKPRNARLAGLWKKNVTVASLKLPSTKGVH